MVLIAIFSGTISGLILKYILDKRWIFNYQTNNLSDELGTFSKYSITGIITTLIFWGVELIFFYIFAFKGSQYIGGSIGLFLGYLLKYYLDKKYVFLIRK